MATKILSFPVLCSALIISIASTLWASNDLFQPARAYRSGGYSAFSLAVGDVNSDGIPDLLVANQCIDTDNCSAGTVALLMGNGDGTFQSARTLDSGGQFALAVALQDVNADGKLDILVANGCGHCLNSDGGPQGRIGVLLGNGDGSFQKVHIFSSYGQSAYAIASGDVNGDSRPDIVVANFCGGNAGCHKGSIAVLTGNGDGTFQKAFVSRAGGYGTQSIGLADVNGDGKVDLLATNMCTRNSDCVKGGIVSVLLGNGDGTFQAPHTYNSGGFYASSLITADVNGDNKVDLLVTNRCLQGKDRCFNEVKGNGVVGVLLGNGDGTFQKAQRFGSGGYGAQSIARADLNGDGKVDALVANLCSTSCTDGDVHVGVLFGNGDGSFQEAQRYPTGGNSAGTSAIGTTDVNRDGNTDVLVADVCFVEFGGCNHGGGVAVLLGRSTTTTQLTSSLNPSDFGQPVALTATVESNGPHPPEGSVTFRNGDRWLGKVTLNGGVATLTTAALPRGVLSLTARYNGETDSVSSTSEVLTQVVH